MGPGRQLRPGDPGICSVTHHEHLQICSLSWVLNEAGGSMRWSSKTEHGETRQRSELVATGTAVTLLPGPQGEGSSTG